MFEYTLNGIAPLDKEYNFTLVKSPTSWFSSVWKYVLTIDGVEVFRENRHCRVTLEKDTFFRGCRFTWRLTLITYPVPSGAYLVPSGRFIDLETFQIVKDGQIVFSGLVEHSL